MGCAIFGSSGVSIQCGVHLRGASCKSLIAKGTDTSSIAHRIGHILQVALSKVPRPEPCSVFARDFPPRHSRSGANDFARLTAGRPGRRQFRESTVHSCGLHPLATHGRSFPPFKTTLSSPAPVNRTRICTILRTIRSEGSGAGEYATGVRHSYSLLATQCAHTMPIGWVPKCSNREAR